MLLVVDSALVSLEQLHPTVGGANVSGKWVEHAYGRLDCIRSFRDKLHVQSCTLHVCIT